MKTATGLALLAVGAILTFAVRAAIPGVNLQVAGLIIMLTGAAGLFVPARASGWLRRRIVLRGPQRPVAEEASEDDTYPVDIIRDPATLAARILQDARAAGDHPQMLPYLGPDGRYVEPDVVDAEEIVPVPEDAAISADRAG
jgi:hypothetical protein